MTGDRPIAAGNGDEFPGLVDERIPGEAAMVDDIVEGLEDTVRQPVCPHELPDVFLTVELRCAWRQWQERDIVGRPEVFCAMPSGLIEDQNGVCSRGDFRCDLVEMKLHGFGVAKRQHEGCASTVFGAYCAEHIGRLGALIVDGARTRAFPGPAIGELVLLADTHLVLEPHFYGCAGRECRADFRHA